MKSTDKIMIRTTGKGLNIVLPTRKQEGAFRSIRKLRNALIFWSIGGVAILFLSMLNMLSSDFSLALVWLFVEILIMMPLIHLLFEKEIILLSERTMSLRTSLFGAGKTRIYQLPDMYDLRLTPTSHVKYGKLCFDYEKPRTLTFWGTFTIGFCKHIERENAIKLLHTLSSILQFHCHSVESIIFGTHQSLDGDPYTTLQNPDVVSLTFPFVHLKQILVNTATYDLLQIERFFTYAVNYMDREYLRSKVEIHIYGEPDRLHPNIRNNFISLFKRVHEYRK